jgi:hypothetical protein
VNIGTNRLIEHLGIRNALVGETITLRSGDQITLYQANGRRFVVHVYADGGGFEVYVPVSPSLSIDTTLAKLDEYIAGTI